MCGIAGVLCLKDMVQEQVAAVSVGMVDAIKHRGPNYRGVWLDQKAGITNFHKSKARS